MIILVGSEGSRYTVALHNTSFIHVDYQVRFYLFKVLKTVKELVDCLGSKCRKPLCFLFTAYSGPDRRIPLVEGSNPILAERPHITILLEDGCSKRTDQGGCWSIAQLLLT